VGWVMFRGCDAVLGCCGLGDRFGDFLGYAKANRLVYAFLLDS
jgi:hypothetical protein